MTRTRLTLAGGCAAAIVLAGAPCAQTTFPADEHRGLPEAAAFDQAIAAGRVAAFGRRQHDPEALLVAARMLQEVPITDQGAPRAGAADQQAPSPFSADALFAEAKSMAAGDPQLITQINLAQSSGSRGVLFSAFGKGLVRSVQEVAARSVYGFDIRASGGDQLRIGAIGDAATRMVMRIVDQHGHLACVDDNGDFAPVCALKPTATTSYKVEIQNQSSVPTRAVILSN